MARALACLLLAAPAARAFGVDITSMGSDITVAVTSTLSVTGKSDGTIDRFFGVPTADTTAGANRFKPPVPLTYSTPTTVTAFLEKPCYQNRLDGNPNVGSEDCVSLDIMTPTGATAGSLPVFIYIHGGGFTRQDPNFEVVKNAYYAKGGLSHLPNDGKCVMIMAHYRLGALGFLALPGLSAESSYGGSGNYGLMDTIHSLGWIQSNIAPFGGDPSKVTIVGESAGGAHVMMLLASPLAEGLFHNAVAESPYISYTPGTFSMSSRYVMGEAIAMEQGCWVEGGADAVVVACLRSKPAFDEGCSNQATAFDAKYGAFALELFTYNSIQAWPVVDGYVLTKAPLESWADGTNKAVNVIAGFNADEYTTFYASDPSADYGGAAYILCDYSWIVALNSPSITSASSFADIFAAVMTVFQAGGPAFQTTYDPLISANIGGYGTYLGYVNSGTDAWFLGGHYLFTEALISQTGRTGGVYQYVFAEGSVGGPQLGVDFLGACHGCELAYVLGMYTEQMSYISQAFGYLTTPITYTAEQTAMGMAMKSYWVTMMYTGSPNAASDTVPEWKGVTTTEEHTMFFKSTFSGGAELDACLNLIGCQVDSVTGGKFREAKRTFWTSPMTTSGRRQLQLSKAAADQIRDVASKPRMEAVSTAMRQKEHKDPRTNIQTFARRLKEGLNSAKATASKTAAANKPRRSMLFGMPAVPAPVAATCAAVSDTIGGHSHAIDTTTCTA